MTTKESGKAHWIYQRITSVVMLPLLVWLLWFIFSLKNKSQAQLLHEIASPINTGLLILFLSNALYHGNLGMKVIIEDYVSNLCKRACYIKAISIFSSLTWLAGSSALLYLMLRN